MTMEYQVVSLSDGKKYEVRYQPEYSRFIFTEVRNGLRMNSYFYFESEDKFARIDHWAVPPAAPAHSASPVQEEATLKELRKVLEIVDAERRRIL